MQTKLPQTKRLIGSLMIGYGKQFVRARTCSRREGTDGVACERGAIMEKMKSLYHPITYAGGIHNPQHMKQSVLLPEFSKTGQITP